MSREGKFMTTNFSGNVSDNKITINLDELGTINYYSKDPQAVDEKSNFLILKDRDIIGLSFGELDNEDEVSNYIEIVVPDNIIAPDFFYFLTKELDQAGYAMNVNYTMTISDESKVIYQKYWDVILPILTAFGLKIVETRRPAAKPRHKYSATLAKVPFQVDYKGSKATVYWKKRNEFVVKKGASLLHDAPLTKAGIIGFAGKFGLRLREEHESQIKDDVLTEDISLRSVNEVGTFLYFAGTNSWLHLKSPEGKTLNELTIVH